MRQMPQTIRLGPAPRRKLKIDLIQLVVMIIMISIQVIPSIAKFRMNQIYDMDQYKTPRNCPKAVQNEFLENIQELQTALNLKTCV